MPKDVKYIILKSSANVVANSTKITHLLIIRQRQTRRPVKCKGVQKHILHQKVLTFSINEFGIIFPLFSCQVPKNMNTATPRSLLTSIGVLGVYDLFSFNQIIFDAKKCAYGYWRFQCMQCRGVLIGHSTAHFYQVLIILK